MEWKINDFGFIDKQDIKLEDGWERNKTISKLMKNMCFSTMVYVYIL